MAVIKLNEDKMAKNSKKRKPSNQDFVNVINMIIQDIHSIQNDLSALIGAFDLFVEMEGKSKELKDYVDKTIKNQNEIQAVRQDNKETIKADSTD